MNKLTESEKETDSYAVKERQREGKKPWSSAVVPNLFAKRANIKDKKV